VARLFATVARVAEARVRNIGRRAAVRAGLIGGCILAALVCLGFVLAAGTVALAEQVGLLNALAIMAGGALLIVLILLGALELESRRHRRYAARRADLDRQLYRAAALSAIPTRAPSRPVIGLGLVALGALLVLARRGERDVEDE
jgi:heme/copper-type cytochrome/quinol oxidase subunit 2